MNTSLEMNPESYDYEKVPLLLNAFKKRIQNLSTDFGIACDMIDQLVTIQLISGILKDIKKKPKMMTSIYF